MIEKKLFCDICGNEAQPGEGAGTFGGVITRMNVKLEKQPWQFNWDTCSSCSEVLLNFIQEMKGDIEKKK